MLRAVARISANACSAADVTLPIGVFMTMMPRRVAASTSMLSTPMPARPISFNSVPASTTSAVTFTRLRTISPCAPAAAAAASFSCGTFGWKSTSRP